MTKAKNPKEMRLGEIVKEIIINQGSIQCLIGGIGDPKYESNTPVRHELERRQDQLYAELNDIDELYRGQKTF